MTTINILLVEDDELFRLGLSTRLLRESDLNIIAEAEDGETAIEMLSDNMTIDMVILDLGLPGISGLETLYQIYQVRPCLPVLALTSHAEPKLIRDLIIGRVQGYCLKGVSAESIILAIRSIMSGSSWWDSTATKEIFAVFSGDKLSSNQQVIDRPEIQQLTKREQEILLLISTGKNNQEIASSLYIAPGTVRVHIHTIFSKIGVRDRTQAAIFAIQAGLITPQLLE